MISIQDTYAPNNKCFGCGPKNKLGLQIKSFPEKEFIVARFLPQEHHQAFDNILSGGICGTLLDCHSNWTAAYLIMKLREETQAPCTVTAQFNVKLCAPTPMKEKLTIRAQPKEITPKKALIHAEIIADEKITAICEGVFVVVKPGHPGYHRW